MRIARNILVAVVLLLIAALFVRSRLQAAREDRGGRPGSGGERDDSDPIRLVPLAPGTRPYAIRAGSDGAIWFSSRNRPGLGRVATSPPFSVSDFAWRSPNPTPESFALGPDGAFWVVANGGYAIVRVPLARPPDLQVFKRLGDARSLYGIAVAPDGMVWLAGAWRLCRMTPSVPPEYEEYPFPYTSVSATSVAVDAQGGVWFTRSDGSLGRANPADPLNPVLFPVANRNSQPQAVAIAPDGAVWFTEFSGNAVGRLDPARSLVWEFSLPSPNSRPRGICSGPDGAMWFAESGAKAIGRFPAHEPFILTEFPIPSALSCPYDVTAGPDGNVWFADTEADAVGRIKPALAGDSIQASEVVARTLGESVQPTVVQATRSPDWLEGQIVVGVDADATVFVDGAERFRLSGHASRTFAIAPGAHEVAVVGAAAGRRITQRIQVQPGRLSFAPFDGLVDEMKPEESGRRKNG